MNRLAWGRGPPRSQARRSLLAMAGIEVLAEGYDEKSVGYVSVPRPAMRKAPSRQSITRRGSPRGEHDDLRSCPEVSVTSIHARLSRATSTGPDGKTGLAAP